MRTGVIGLSLVGWLVLSGSQIIEVKTHKDGDNNLHSIACSGNQPNDASPWHISNLYNCESGELFIPYQLWTGAEWHGNKSNICMHNADTRFYVNGISGTRIMGPREWKNPATGDLETIWAREKINGSKQQYFTCHAKGVGRVYDSRGPRYYVTGRCKFPAGHGWTVGEKRRCTSTQIEITKIDLGSNRGLLGLEFKWWYQRRNGDYVHDHTYRYEPNRGMVNAWKQ